MSNATTPTKADAAWIDVRATTKARKAAAARQAGTRRRFVDPTTCDRDDRAAEMEFMGAMQEYKRSSGRMFPTWSEVLEVLVGLGYEKPSRDAPAEATGDPITAPRPIAAPPSRVLPRARPRAMDRHPSGKGSS